MKKVKVCILTVLFVLLMCTCVFAKTTTIKKSKTLTATGTYKVIPKTSSAISVKFRAKKTGVYSFKFYALNSEDGLGRLSVHDSSTNLTLLDRDYYTNRLNEYTGDGLTFTDAYNAVMQEQNNDENKNNAFVQYTLRYQMVKGMFLSFNIGALPPSSFKLKITRADW